MSVQFAMVDLVGEVSTKELEEVCAALTAQAKEDFASVYGTSATVRLAASPADIKAGERILARLKHPDEAGAYGYHDVDKHGHPVDKIFPLLDEQDGHPWSVTASHEVIETLGDMWCIGMLMGVDGRVWAAEHADPCERQSYQKGGVVVSDFVLPAWYGGGKLGLKHDWMDTIHGALQVLSGGYAQWFDPTLGWQQVLASKREEDQPRATRRNYPGRTKRRQEAFSRVHG